MNIDTLIGDKGLYITDCIDQASIEALLKLDKTMKQDEMIHFYTSQYRDEWDKSLVEYLNKATRDAFLEYFNKFGGSILDYLVYDVYRINTWKTGIELHPHVDAKKNPGYNQASSPRPSVSGLIYLTNDYEGGEIYFPEQQLSIKPESGSIILFDSTLLHGVNEVKSGIRKTISCNLFSIYSDEIEEFKTYKHRQP
jgi:predicted 2-oxoglutarate/Fe(II)-dependent dioxygenase YbiX